MLSSNQITNINALLTRREAYLTPAETTRIAETSRLAALSFSTWLPARDANRRSGLPRDCERSRAIVEPFDPEQIILFGSHARNQAHEHSDIDLLVVMNPEGSRRERALEIGMAVHPIASSADVTVVTPDEFAWRKDVVGTIEYPAAREGRRLYERR